MKEEPELFSEMTTARLHQLRVAWTSQIAFAEREGWQDRADRMRVKLSRVEYQIRIRQNENLNDLFG